MYVYEQERHRINTEEGRRVLIYTNREAHDLIEKAGAATQAKICDAVTSRMGAVKTYDVMTAVRYMVEIGQMKQVETHPAIFIRS